MLTPFGVMRIAYAGLRSVSWQMERMSSLADDRMSSRALPPRMGRPPGRYRTVVTVGRLSNGTAPQSKSHALPD